jgi:hypothetical protein
MSPAPRPLAALALALAALTAGCNKAPARQPEAAAGPARGAQLRFLFDAIDGRRISTDAFANRISVIAFLTTYDVHSQVEARFLATLATHHTPRINVAALMLEAPENKPLVEAFVTSLGLPYPVALADAPTIAGEGPFAGLHHVPSIVILDRQGREAFRFVGFLDEASLEKAVKAVEATAAPGSYPAD